jgi:hypothetical protein
MKAIILPQPQYQFGQQVFVIGSDTRTKYEPCYVCKGEGKVQIQGCSIKAECPQCKGRGHHHQNATNETVHFVAGRLTIRGCHVEVVENPQPDSIWSSDRDRLTYRGEMLWTDSVPQGKRGWNVFSEVSIYPTLEAAKEAVYNANNKSA